MPRFENEPPELAMSEAEARYYEELEREEARLAALPRVKGSRAIAESGECDRCGTVAVLYGRDACTLGYPGHPGAEWTTFRVCAECLR